MTFTNRKDGTYPAKYSSCRCYRRLIAIDEKTLKCPGCGLVIMIKTQKQAEKEMKRKRGKGATQTFIVSQQRKSEEDKYRTEDEAIAGWPYNLQAGCRMVLSFIK